MKHEIYFNKKLGNYTLEKSIEGVDSIKKKPLRFKLKDSTSRFRKEQLKETILSSQK